MINKYCLTSDKAGDLFVGIRFLDGSPQVIFPHGYAIPSDEKECRKDIFRLLGVLQMFSNHEEGENVKNQKKILAKLPISSYQYIIQDFLQNGYYTEKEVRYVRSQRGKISWKRTIQQEDAQIDDGNVIYLNFQVKTNHIKSDNLLTHIHRYCVYQSFFLFGWLYFSSDYLPEKPRITFNKKLFLSVLKQALSNTFNDSKRKLFQSMINILSNNDDEMEIKSLSIGVNRFDPVWEKLIDVVFGEPDKGKYFPHATWHIIKNGIVEQSSALEPDTIMKYDGKLYVLDAKYYRYGISDRPNDLPPTSSIQKQITYGKHIAENFNEVEFNHIYNAFVMPFDSKGADKTKFVSVGTADWEIYSKNTPNYAYVLGILLDTRWLITEYSKYNESEIESLARMIEESLNTYRRMINQ